MLKSGDNKGGKKESTIVAAQDQVISKNYFKNKILKEEIDSKCRLCTQHEETINHRMAHFGEEEYLMRHKVCAHLHYSICKALGTETTVKWHTHTPTSVYEQEDITVLWNRAVHTDREVTANRTHTIIKNKKEKTCIMWRYPWTEMLSKRKGKRS